MKNDLQYAVELIRQADGILITAGAGMSVDSGLPDFRSVGGIWRAYPPLEKYQLNFEQLATPETYLRRPQLGYWFFGYRLKQYRNAIPHQGYQILKRWAETKPYGYFVFTSNVDGQFQKAGYKDERVYEVHGSLHRLQCLQNCQHKSWRADEFNPVLDDKHCAILTKPPRCPDCGGLARQNVLMFNDRTFCESHYAPKKQALNQWLEQVEKLVVIELGAGKAIPTVRYFSERTAKHKKAGFIRINPVDAGVGKHHFLGLDMTALTALQTLDQRLSEKSG